MTFPPINWIKLGASAWMLGAESAVVIALRLSRFAQGGGGAVTEAERMVSEKAHASLELGAALLSGKMGLSPASVADYTLVYGHRHVRANIRRLVGSSK